MCRSKLEINTTLIYVLIFALLALCLVLPVALDWVLIDRFGGFDIAIFSQIIYNVATIHQPISTVATPLHHMGTHLEPIVYLLGILWIPFGYLGSYPYRFLMIASLAANLLVVILLFFHCRLHALRKNVAILVPVILTVTHWGFW